MDGLDKQRLDREALSRIIAGVECYANLDAKGTMERLRNHREDAFCEIWNTTSKHRIMCTRDGHNAIVELAERHRESLAVPDDFSVAELVDGLQRHLAKAIVEEPEEDDVLRRALGEAVTYAKKDHVERTYHFACVVVHQKEPKQFRIGNVTFTNGQNYRDLLGKELDRYTQTGKGRKVAEILTNDFVQDVKELGWVASVTVPPCNKEVAKRRAETAVKSAINVLRLAFGIQYGRDMRLVHISFAQPTRSQYAITEKGKFDIVGSRRSSGANVPEDWHAQLSQWHGFWELTAEFLQTTVAGTRSEMSYRLEDALTWFGEAAFEDSGGMQVVNFVAALERLTTTGRFRLHNFCSRVALLAYEEDKDFEQAYWNGYEIYSARSAVMHGGFSPTDRSFGKKVRLAHEVTRTTLLRAFEVHQYLHTGGRNGRLDALRSFYTAQQSKWAKTLKSLEGELKLKKGE
jgi:Apea-like HEPN